MFYSLYKSESQFDNPAGTITFPACNYE